MNKPNFEKIIDSLEEDPIFPRPYMDPKMLTLQGEVVDFVTSVILKHEKEFYQLVQKIFPSKLEYLLGSTGPSIISMITEITKEFYNKIYYDIQHKIESDTAKLVLKICQNTDYGPHILLDKLLRLTFEVHLDVVREQLVVQNDDYDLYQKSVLNQINVVLLSKNLPHIMTKCYDEDTEFVNIPEGENAFNIVIDKNINV